jgi:ribosomal protein S18 acetylase RimI-like enzyme
MAQPLIRPAQTDDLPHIGGLWAEMVLSHQERFSDMPRLATDGAALYARRLTERLHDANARVLVAEHDSAVIGYAFAVVADLHPEVFHPERSGYIADLCVDARHRRAGVGRALVQALRVWFAAHQVDHFEWYVATANAEANAFWRAVGGQPIMTRMRATLDLPNTENEPKP